MTLNDTITVKVIVYSTIPITCHMMFVRANGADNMKTTQYLE